MSATTPAETFSALAFRHPEASRVRMRLLRIVVAGFALPFMAVAILPACARKVSHTITLSVSDYHGATASDLKKYAQSVAVAFRTAQSIRTNQSIIGRLGERAKTVPALCDLIEESRHVSASETSVVITFTSGDRDTALALGECYESALRQMMNNTFNLDEAGWGSRYIPPQTQP